MRNNGVTLTSGRAKALHNSSISIKVEFVLHWVYILRGSLMPWLFAFLTIRIPFPFINCNYLLFQSWFKVDFILSYHLGEIKGKLTHFKMCAFRRVLEKGQQLSFGCNDYLFGNAVQITTNSRILSLCEVEVYSYSYGKNSILHHLWFHVKSQTRLFHKFILQIS